MITVELDKDDLINLLCGYSPKTHDIGNELVKIGFMEYHGGFYDEYEWKRDNLARLDEKHLHLLYKVLTKPTDYEINKHGIMVKISI